MSNNASSSVFERYASYYDLFYENKDYVGECDFIEAAWARLAIQPRTVLDLAGGTGNHGLRLAERGYQLTGVDRAPEMLTCYAQKAHELGVAVELHQADLRALNLNRRFDAAICMFDAVCYLTANSDLRAFFAGVRAHLSPQAPIMFDVWHAAPLLNAHDPVRVREAVLSGTNRRVQRTSITTLHAATQTANVEFRFHISGGGEPDEEFAEVHTLRYFGAAEVQFILEACGYRVHALCPAFDLDAPITEETWHLVVLAVPHI